MRFPQEILPDVIVYFKQLRRKGIKSIHLSGSFKGAGVLREQAAREDYEEGRAAARPRAGAHVNDTAKTREKGTIKTTTKSTTKTTTKTKPGLEQLRSKVAACTECPLCGTRTNTVFGVGNPETRVMFVGEAPGRDEDLKGEPFVGRAGQLLNKILAAIELKREEVYITNILKCRPPQNRDPQESEIRCCEEYLKKQIDLIRPKVVCALGRIAAQWLLQTNAPLGTLRAGEYYYEGIPVVPTYHPAALLRNPAFKKPTWEDFKKLKGMLDED